MESLIKSESKLECPYCNRRFSKPSTLSVHLCSKKQRHLEINSTASRYAFQAFNRFFQITQYTKRSKTETEFISSPFYIEFYKFGNHVAGLEVIQPTLFIDFIIRKNIKLKEWTYLQWYYEFVDNIVKTEASDAAIERSLSEIDKWCQHNKVEFIDFFSAISIDEAVDLIRLGKISPWMLYLSNTSSNLMNRFPQSYSASMSSIINPKVWTAKFTENADEMTNISDALNAAGI
jgi:hypothetical protein